LRGSLDLRECLLGAIPFHGNGCACLDRGNRWPIWRLITPCAWWRLRALEGPGSPGSRLH
jgi:hypothetical protein